MVYIHMHARKDEYSVIHGYGEVYMDICIEIDKICVFKTAKYTRNRRNKLFVRN